MGCFSFCFTLLYFWAVAGIASETRDGFWVVFWGVLFYVVGRGVLRAMAGPTAAAGGDEDRELLLQLRRSLLLRERVARAQQAGLVTPEEVRQVLIAQGARERRTLAGPESTEDPQGDEAAVRTWLRALEERGRISTEGARAITEVSLAGPFPPPAAAAGATPSAPPELRLVPEAAAPATEVPPEATQPRSFRPADPPREAPPAEVPLIQRALDLARREATEESGIHFVAAPPAPPAPPPGRTAAVAPGVALWTPESPSAAEAAAAARDVGAILEGGPSSPAVPSFWERLKSNFMEEEQVRWADALFALFTLLAFVTGVVSLGYFWSDLNPYLRFAFLVAGAAGACRLARRVHGMEGLEESGRTLAVIAHLLAPVALGALPFLAGPEAGGAAMALALGLGTGALGWALSGVTELALGAHAPRVPRIFLGAAATSGLLPMLLVESPFRGLVITAVLLGWLGAEGARQGEGEEWAGGRLVRLCLPVYLMGVAVGAAAGIAPLAPGAWAFAAAMAGYLLWTAGLEEGAGGDSFPGVPMGLLAAGFAFMGLGILASALVQPVFWANPWLLASLTPALFASTLSALRTGTGRAAYTSAALLTLLAVIAAGPELGAHSTLVLLPVAGASLGALLLAGRAPAASRAYSRASLGLLAYVLAKGMLVPLEGLTSAVALLAATVPLVVVLRSRPAAFLASASAAACLVFGVHVLWTMPARAALGTAAPLGPLAGPMAAAPFLALAAGLLALAEQLVGKRLTAWLGPPRGRGGLAREEPLGALHLPLALGALPGLLVGLVLAVGWSGLGPESLPGGPGIAGLWAHALGALWMGLTGLARARDQRPLAGHLVAAGVALAPPLLLGFLGGASGVALGLGVAALGAAHMAAHASGDLPGGDGRVRRHDPLPAAALAAGALLVLVVGLPDMMGWLLDPVLEVPPVGPAVAAGLMILAGLRLNRALPFAVHLHLAPLWVAYACLSLSQYWPDRVRLALLAVVAGLMALHGLREGWERFEVVEAAAGGGPAARGWRPLADVPLLLAGAAALLGLSDLAATLSAVLWDVVLGQLSLSYGAGHLPATAVGTGLALGLGAALLGARRAYDSIRGFGGLGGLLVALGTCHLVDVLWWPGSLRPTCAVLSAGFTTCLLEGAAFVLPRQRLAGTARRIRIGALGLIGLVAFSGVWLAVHRSQAGPVYESLRGNWSGGALALAVFFIALSGWGRAVRGESQGGHRLTSGFAITLGLAGAWLGGLVGATWGFSLACLLAAELGASQGEHQIGGGEFGSLLRPLASGALVAAAFVVGSILVPNLSSEQLPLLASPALLLLVRAGWQLNRAAPFALHLHSAPLLLFYGFWMFTRDLRPHHRAAALAGAGLVVALAGFTGAWRRLRDREAAAGGGLVAWGFEPLVDASVLVALGATVYGWLFMLVSAGQTTLAILTPASVRLPQAGGWFPAASMGILPLVGVGAILVAGRGRAAYLRVLGMGYLGGGALALGLTHALALPWGGPWPCLARLLAAVAVAWVLDELAARVSRARYPALPRCLRSGCALVLALLMGTGALLLDELPRRAVEPLLGGPLALLLLGLLLASVLALRLARRGTWGIFTWPHAWLLLVAAQLGAVECFHLQGWPLPRFDHGPHAVWVVLGVAQLLGWGGLKLATPNMGRHLGGVLVLLAGGGVACWVDLVDRLGQDAFLVQHRVGFAGAVLVGLAVALARRGRPHAREQLMVAVPVAGALLAVPGAWPLVAAGSTLHLAVVHSGASLLTWGAVAGGALGLGLGAAGLARTTFGAGTAVPFGAFGLGLALAAAALRGLAARRAGEGGGRGRLLAGWPAPLMAAQAGVLVLVAGTSLGLLYLPLGLEYAGHFPGMATRHAGEVAAYAVFLAAGLTLLAAREEAPRWSTAAGLGWVVAGGYLLAAPLPVAGFSPRSWQVASGYGAFLTCLLLARLGASRPPAHREALARASRLGVGLAILRLAGCLEVPAPDLGAALAAALPALGAAFLWREAAREESEALVYAGEAAAACSFLYLRMSGILSGSIYGQVALQLVAFVLLAVAERLRGGEHAVFHRPFLRTARVIPALVMVRMFLPLDWKGLDGWGQFSLGAMASAFYALVGLREDRATLRYLSGVCFYLGLTLLLLRYYDLRSFFDHLDFYIVPLGLLVTLFSVLEKENLLEEQQRTMRTVGLLLVYISPAAHAVFSATAAATVALMLLGLLGILVGNLSRTRLFTMYGVVAVGTGAGSFLLNVYQMARWNLAFLTFTTLAVGFGAYSAHVRRERRDMGLG